MDVEQTRAKTPQQFEYVARNLKKIIGPGLERDLNKHGREGWEAVCVADGYIVFKRPVT